MDNTLKTEEGTKFYLKQFIKDFIMHYTPLLLILKTMFGYKTTSYLGVSLFLAITFETILNVLNLSFLGIPIFLGVLITCLILVDWWAGTAASIVIAKAAKTDGNMELYEEKKFNKSKIGWVVFKFIALFLWIPLAYGVNHIMEGIKFAEVFFDVVTVVPILLFGFKEFISIGNHIKTLIGKKPYLFELGEKIFHVTEIGFLKKFK